MQQDYIFFSNSSVAHLWLFQHFFFFFGEGVVFLFYLLFFLFPVFKSWKFKYETLSVCQAGWSQSVAKSVNIGLFSQTILIFQHNLRWAITHWAITIIWKVFDDKNDRLYTFIPGIMTDLLQKPEEMWQKIKSVVSSFCVKKKVNLWRS